MREALSNTVRHSGAAPVSVEITVADDLTIVVEDDGCGMPGEVTPSGLTNLARRAEDAAGSFTVASGTGSDGDSAGTRLCWKCRCADRDTSGWAARGSASGEPASCRVSR
ncbi:sensor histidine kinase [Nocardia asiatica]|nr:ATP-binding protein [Nocardia asiatica]